jgi:hypothetical protein
MPGLWRDDNANSINDAMALHETYGSAGIVVATTGASTAEISLNTLTGLGANGVSLTEVGQNCMVCISNGSANDALYAFGAAGAAASFTASSNMVLIPKQWVKYVRIDPSVDKSFYHLQITGATTLQVCLLK